MSLNSKGVFLMCVLSLQTPCARADSSSVTGLWQVYDDKARAPHGVVRLVIEHGKLSGYIERLPEGRSARDLCTKCPPPQTNRPFLGLKIAWDLERDDDGWRGGTILDPDTGDTYRCKMTLTSPDRLKVRGFIGLSIFGRTQYWRRTK